MSNKVIKLMIGGGVFGVLLTIIIMISYAAPKCDDSSVLETVKASATCDDSCQRLFHVQNVAEYRSLSSDQIQAIVSELFAPLEASLGGQMVASVLPMIKQAAFDGATARQRMYTSVSSGVSINYDENSKTTVCQAKVVLDQPAWVTVNKALFVSSFTQGGNEGADSVIGKLFILSNPRFPAIVDQIVQLAWRCQRDTIGYKIRPVHPDAWFNSDAWVEIIPGSDADTACVQQMGTQAKALITSLMFK